ncbi:MAG TPA: hypothetical protein VH084_28495 [Mycobacterium sp.]|jgi:hypothetical protein|nr:hypothetical protein [Mycobacterium sp.]
MTQCSPSGLGVLAFNLVIPQAADWPGINYPIIGPDGSPYDLSGCSARGQIRPHPGSDEIYFTWSTSPAAGEGLITFSGTTLNIRVLATESEPWVFAQGAYDILLNNPAAPLGLRTSRVAMGSVTVSPEVTQ